MDERQVPEDVALRLRADALRHLPRVLAAHDADLLAARPDAGGVQVTLRAPAARVAALRRALLTLRASADVAPRAAAAAALRAASAPP